MILKQFIKTIEYAIKANGIDPYKQPIDIDGAFGVEYPNRISVEVRYNEMPKRAAIRIHVKREEKRLKK